MVSDEKNTLIGLSFRREGRYIHLVGRIDEFADYGPLLAMDPPLRLVLSQVRALNSHGIRKWMLFIRAWGLKQIEFHECPEIFVDTVNMFGDLVSANGNMKRIKSVLVPVFCDPCKASGSRLLPLADVHFRSEFEVVAPLAPCARCHRSVLPLVALEDYLWFSQVQEPDP